MTAAKAECAEDMENIDDALCIDHAPRRRGSASVEQNGSEGRDTIARVFRSSTGESENLRHRPCWLLTVVKWCGIAETWCAGEAALVGVSQE